MDEIDLRYSIFHGGFQSHSAWRPGDRRGVELALKRMALFYESVLVSDSDLNNNGIMAGLLDESVERSVFREAISCGFVRRAVRVKGEQEPGAISQQELFEGYKKSNPERASRVPDGHPATLDRLFADAERRHKGGHYHIDRLAGLFAARILFNLERDEAAFSDGSRFFAARIREYVTGLLDTGTVQLLKAAELDTRFGPPDRLDNPDWQAVWRDILDAYTGNLPGAFDSELTTANPVPAEANPIPGGPLASPDDQDYILGWLEEPARATLHQERAPGEASVSRYEVESSSLYGLPLPRIIELREHVGRHPYFDARHRVLGGAPGTEVEARRLAELKDAYLDEIARTHATLVRHEKTARAVLGACRETWLVDEARQREILVCTFIPGTGEFTRLFRTGGTPADWDSMAENNFMRPNYSLFRRVATTSGPDASPAEASVISAAPGTPPGTGRR